MLALIIFICSSLFSQSYNKKISLIPLPVSIKAGQGNFILKPSTVIEFPGGNADIKRVANFLSKKLSQATGYAVTEKATTGTLHLNTQGCITLKIINNARLGTEGYILEVTPTSITISAVKASGLFYGMETLLQLLPKEIESKTAIDKVSWNVPTLNIIDYPRFGWRGLMLDVSRHFFTKQQVKDFIDNMVQYKYNLLHLHLTDDQGWRIEIKSFPNLTKIGAWRPNREGAWGNTKAPDPGEPKTYGGFYTQEDIKELVQYAKDRFVNILPEIEMPAHSMAAIASYPELSCTPGTYSVNVGEEFQVWNKGGNKALIDNTFCPASETVYAFLDKVLTEVALLFPFEYIHVGGDEAAKNFWEQSDAVKSLMKKEGLNSMEEVQSYFVKRVEKIVQSKGKKLMGWDEILEGGLAPSASVMSWRGMKGGIQAASMNHHVVMAPEDFTYVDLMQGDSFLEPPEFASLLLNQSYRFDPVPPGVDSKFILGGEACLWTEHTTNMRAAQYLLWPRGLSVAESVWSPKEKKDWNDFIARVEHQFERMDVVKINYSRSMYNPVFKASKDTNAQLTVELQTQIPDLVIHYSFDETNPDEFYPKYEKPLVVPIDALHLKVVTYRNGKPIGNPINIPIEELQRRVKSKTE
ncbi:MAG: family 20 glycosylhydrolase [Flavisolibacter sp.]